MVTLRRAAGSSSTTNAQSRTKIDLIGRISCHPASERGTVMKKADNHH
jgi:hypothetical protein